MGLMTPNSLESDYAVLCSSLQTRVHALMAHWPAIFGFWERWCTEHRAAIRVLAGREYRPANDESAWPALLIRRKRMVSALSQGLRANGLESKSFGEELTFLLRDHDSGFITLLQTELESVREQMTFAFSVRKTMNAYAQTAQYRRE
jgi:hypothetical protein